MATAIRINLHSQTINALFTLVMMTSHVVLASEWLDAPYPDDSFNVRAEYGSNATLSCAADMSNGNNETAVAYWILPDMSIMSPGQSIQFR